tara:strand:- start:126 stop:650 length:525 start_codon:yes stop_codon:yes gene_type:complete
MADLKKYSFNKYSEKYKQLFNREKTKLKRIFPRLKIEHVGSTAIPGLGGKGIIDIAIKIPRNKLNESLKKLEGLKYEHSKNHPKNVNRVFLQRKIRHGGKERRVHVHLVFDNEFWESFIVVRDYLRNHNKKCKEYIKIKKEAIKHAKGEGEKYRGYKNSFLKKILKLALKEYPK